jgi:hypothetical protein
VFGNIEQIVIEALGETPSAEKPENKEPEKENVDKKLASNLTIKETRTKAESKRRPIKSKSTIAKGRQR